jgi:hypothetical protein
VAPRAKEKLPRHREERICEQLPLGRAIASRSHWHVETNEFVETTRIRKGEGGTMKLQSKIATSVGLMLFLACVSFAQQVKTDYDHSANFVQFKTYSWEKVQTKDPLLVDRIKSAVNSALAAKGWTEVPSGGDVEVFAIETTQNQQTLDTFYNGFGGGRRWGFGGGFGNATTTVETYKVGTLVVDLFDAKTEKLIWRSSSSDTLSDKADKNTKNLNKGVNKMFQHFPPAASAKQ